MKRFFAILICLIIALSPVMPTSASATELSIEEKEIIYFEDGSRLEIVTIPSYARASGSKTGSKSYTFLDSSNETKWNAVLTASFTYTGLSSSCTSASCSVSIYDNNWYIVSKSTYKSGNTATAELTMGHKVLGITVSKPSFTLTLSCDKSGNLS